MDESKKQGKNLFANLQNFLHTHQKVIIILSVIFFLVFTSILVLLMYFRKQQASLQSAIIEKEGQLSVSNLEIKNGEKVVNSLFPTFTEQNLTNSTSTENDLRNTDFFDEYEGEGVRQVTESVTAIELRPILGFTQVNQKISIKEFITKKPTSCLQKIETAKKDESSENVNNIQKTLATFPGIKAQELTQKLDEHTRNNIYIIQKRYNSIIYQNTINKEPSRIVDKQTAHFLNILCGFEKEADNEFVFIPIIRYVLKETGDVIEFNTRTKQKSKFKLEVPKSPEETLFSNDGNFVIYRSQDEKGIIKTKILNIKNNVTFDMEDNIKTITFSPEGRIAYGVKKGDNLDINTYDIFTQKVAFLSSIPLTEWYIEWQDNQNLRITNKPTALAYGISLTLDIKNKKFLQDISPLIGLNTKNLSSKKFTLVQTGGVGQSSLLLLNNETKNLSTLNVSSFIEKCSKNILKNGIFCAVPEIINKVNLYPDDWYKERISTKDKIVYINFEGGNIVDIAALSDKEVSVKEINVSSAGIFYQDTKNLGLYSLSVN
jgi:hypothetical protein